MLKYKNIKHPCLNGHTIQVQHHGHGDWSCTESFVAGMRTLKGRSLKSLKTELAKDFCLSLLGRRAYALFAFVEGHKMCRFIVEDESQELIPTFPNINNDVYFKDLPKDAQLELLDLTDRLRYVLVSMPKMNNATKWYAIKRIFELGYKKRFENSIYVINAALEKETV